MKKTPENRDHQIQLKRDEIARYLRILNPKYPPKDKKPGVEQLQRDYLAKLEAELAELEKAK